VEGIIRVFERGMLDPVNLGNPEERTILNFAEQVLKISGSHSPIQYLPARTDDPKQRRPNIMRAKRFLNWAPLVTLETGLERTIDFFRTQL
jgi:nucleoside-diphosphate-sugar epimerase